MSFAFGSRAQWRALHYPLTSGEQTQSRQATIYEILDDRSDRPLGQGIPAVAGNLSVDRWWLKSQIVADRYYAVHLPGELGDPAAIPVLERLRDDAEVGYKVPWALDQIPFAGVKKLQVN